MRSLSPTLLAAQRSQSAVPFVKVQVLDMLAGVVRPSLSRLYTGAEEESHHAATAPADGSLLRVRVESAPKDLLVQRVANPGPGSDFSGWTVLDTAGPNCSIALCSRGASVLLFFVDPFNGKTIYLRESSDNGATWGARQTVLVPAVSVVQWLAAALSASGTPALFYISSAPTVYVTKRTGGVWSNPVSWSNTVSTVTGMACVYTKDWDLALTGADSGGQPGLWTFMYGDGGDQASGTWSVLQPLSQAQGDSDVEFHTPFLVVPDVTRLAYMEKYNGVTSSRRMHLVNTVEGTSFAEGQWRDSIPFDLEMDQGLALASDGETLWLSYPPGVWSGALADPPLDISDDVLALTTQEGPDGAHLTVVLDNSDGRYGSVGSGAYAAIRQGSEVRVSLGYVTPAGEEVSAGPAYWISGWEYLSQGGRATFTLRGVDAWGLLGGWHARRQFSWAAGQSSILDILTFILTRVGLTMSAPDPSSTITTHKPDFTVHPGQSGSAVARRLLALAPDVFFFRGHQGQLRQARESDPTDYAFGTDHSLLEGHYARQALPYTRVQVYGAAGVAERFAWDEVPLQGERLLQQHDLNLDTMQKADDRCQELLRRLERDSLSGDVTVGPNCGQELYDVVEVTDPRAGLAAVKRRVAGLRLDFRRSGEPRYLQRLTLGGV